MERQEKPGEAKRTPEELVRDYESVILDIPIGEGPAYNLPIRREWIHQAGILNKDVIELDQIVIEETLEGSLDWLTDRESQPLEKWWWHLQKIYHRSYPAELLPEYLRSLYLKHLKKT